jgi:Skp family chaperone for outer membrane proteins
VKKFILSLTAVAALLTVLFTAVPTSGQSGQPAAAQRQPPRPHQVGLIDMAFVFNNYEKFKAMQTSLQNEFKAAQEKAKVTVEEVKALQAQLASGTLNKDSPEAAQIEQQIIRKTTDLQAYGQIIQREQLKKEAEVYKQIYLEVQDAIRIYADAYGYTLILRFDREAVEEAQDPQQILQRMTRQVVYFRGQDDLTSPILTHLNKQYGGAATNAAARPAAAPATR